jgi:hypothetical protein
MERRVSRPRTPERSNQVVATTSPSLRKTPTVPISPRTPRSSMSTSSSGSRSPRNPENTLWKQEMRRRTFLCHLNRWSLSHDSCSNFHGTISVCAYSDFKDDCELGKSVHCILTHKIWAYARQRIVIRLFAPRDETSCYRLVVRSGAGWVTAREYFSQDYFHFRRLDMNKYEGCSQAMTNMFMSKSKLLGPDTDVKDMVTISPRFHPFLRLPVELQQLILGTAVGKKEFYQPARSPRQMGFSTYNHTSGQLESGRFSLLRFVLIQLTKSIVQAAIPLDSSFKISKSLSQHLIPWIYRTTTFHFNTTGFTNFLWQAGPTNRNYINKIALCFGRSAIIHCIRWLAPDPVFTLFNPPLSTEPPALQYLWRCQIQDLIKQLNLTLLTIDVQSIPIDDIPFVVRTLSECFGGCKKIRITSSGVTVKLDDERLAGLKKRQTWAELCKMAFENHVWEPWYFDKKVRSLSVDVLTWEIKERGPFFDRTNDTDLFESLVAS